MREAPPTEWHSPELNRDESQVLDDRMRNPEEGPTGYELE